jgi:hypothetical protein
VQPDQNAYVIVGLLICALGTLPGFIAGGRGHHQTAPITLLGALLPLALGAQLLWWHHAIANQGLAGLIALSMSGQFVIYQALPWTGVVAWLAALTWACSAVVPAPKVTAVTEREPVPTPAEVGAAYRDARVALERRSGLPPHVQRMLDRSAKR